MSLRLTSPSNVLLAANRLSCYGYWPVEKMAKSLEQFVELNSKETLCFGNELRELLEEIVKGILMNHVPDDADYLFVIFYCKGIRLDDVDIVKTGNKILKLKIYPTDRFNVAGDVRIGYSQGNLESLTVSQAERRDAVVQALRVFDEADIESFVKDMSGK